MVFSLLSATLGALGHPYGVYRILTGEAEAQRVRLLQALRFQLIRLQGEPLLSQRTQEDMPFCAPF